MLDEPAVVLLAATAAAVFLLLEVALPTVGLAGTAGIALAALAAWGAERHAEGDEWWPLLGVVTAVAVWGVLIAVHRHPVQAQVAAAVLFGGGALGYAATTGDAPAAAAAVVATPLLAAFAFPRLARASERLLGAPPQVGMDAMVGAAATVASWEGDRGRVTLEGTLWNAEGPAGLEAGAPVVVTGTTGLSLRVDAVPSRHG